MVLGRLQYWYRTWRERIELAGAGAAVIFWLRGNRGSSRSVHESHMMCNSCCGFVSQCNSIISTVRSRSTRIESISDHVYSSEAIQGRHAT